MVQFFLQLHALYQRLLFETDALASRVDGAVQVGATHGSLIQTVLYIDLDKITVPA